MGTISFSSITSNPSVPLLKNNNSYQNNNVIKEGRIEDEINSNNHKSLEKLHQSNKDCDKIIIAPNKDFKSVSNLRKITEYEDSAAVKP